MIREDPLREVVIELKPKTIRPSHAMARGKSISINSKGKGPKERMYESVSMKYSLHRKMRLPLFLRNYKNIDSEMAQKSFSVE